MRCDRALADKATAEVGAERWNSGWQGVVLLLKVGMPLCTQQPSTRPTTQANTTHVGCWPWPTLPSVQAQRDAEVERSTAQQNSANELLGECGQLALPCT